MNFFRIAGDMCHLLSFVVMFYKLQASGSCAGISLKTQELFLIVFLTRYVDLFTSFYGVYNSFMKVAYIASTSCVGPLLFFAFDRARRAAGATTHAVDVMYATFIVELYSP